MIFQTRDKNPVPPEYISGKMAIGLADTVLGICAMLVMNYTTEEYTNGTRTAVEIAGNDSNGKPTGNTPQNKPQQGNKFEDIDELSL